MNLKLLAINQLIVYLLINSFVVTIGVNPCSVDMCSREYSGVLDVSQQWSQSMSSRESTQQYCSLLNAYQQCLRSIARSCRGNLEFHTLQTLIKNWKVDRNCSQSQSSIHSTGHKPLIVPNSQRRSGQSSVLYNNNQLQQQNSQQKIVEQQERLQLCLSSAYNYTINTNTSKSASISASDPRTQRLTTSDGLRSRRKGVRRETRSAGSEPSVKTNFFPIRGETVELNEEIDKNEFNSDTMSSTVPTVKPSVPPSPPLTCIIYGDPHLRTFNNEYQTCRCSGAWPLVDHPLFAVQITNSRIKGASPQITGVTKVVVLVRQFTKCGIHNDLLYEADSQSTPGGQSSGTPSATFIDGSTSNSNNLIRITQSSNNNVITIHLDHIGVRVYISQFESSGYLNAVIKFRSATSTVKQQLVLNSISGNSLCKTGCPKREQIDIQNILKATGIDINANSAQQTDNSVNNDYKPDSTVIDNNEDIETDEDQEDMPEDPCRDLYGYYRISCLYDVTIKGVKDVNNANRFAQSFDERKFIHNSIQSAVNSVSDDYHKSVKIIANSSPKVTIISDIHCLNIFLVFVISLIIGLL